MHIKHWNERANQAATLVNISVPQILMKDMKMSYTSWLQFFCCSSLLMDKMVLLCLKNITQYSSGSWLGPILPYLRRVNLVICGLFDFIFGGHNWGGAVLASWKKPGTLLNILQYTGHSVDKELSPAKCQWFRSGVSLPHLANKMENCFANNGWQGCREEGTLPVEIRGQTAFEESNLATCMQFNNACFRGWTPSPPIF